MDRKRWAQIITVAVIVLGAVGASSLFPAHVNEWALWVASVVTAISGALGFNTGRASGNGPGGSVIDREALSSRRTELGHGGRLRDLQRGVSTGGGVLLPSVLPRLLLHRGAQRFWAWISGGRSVVAGLAVFVLLPGCARWGELSARERLDLVHTGSCTAVLASAQGLGESVQACQTERCVGWHQETLDGLWIAAERGCGVTR